MTVEITDTAQKHAIKRLQIFASTFRKGTVRPDMAVALDIEDAVFTVRAGQTIWVNPATNDTFYVTLEEQKVQLTFIVQRQSCLVSKKSLNRDGSRVGARPTKGVTYSS